MSTTSKVMGMTALLVAFEVFLPEIGFSATTASSSEAGVLADVTRRLSDAGIEAPMGQPGDQAANKDTLGTGDDCPGAGGAGARTSGPGPA